MFCTLHKYKLENAVIWYANYTPSHCDGVTDTDSLTARPGVAPGNGSIHKLLHYYRPHNMGLRLRHTSLFLTYVLAPLCAISNFNYEQVNTRDHGSAAIVTYIQSSGKQTHALPSLPCKMARKTSTPMQIMCYEKK